MKLAVMQPYFFPYIGYFHMINAVDRFVFYDDVNFIEYGWINRNNLLLNGKAWKFSVPLLHMSSFVPINNTKIDPANFESWRKKFLKTVELNYKKAPYYQNVYELLCSVVNAESILISELAKHSITNACKYIGLNVGFVDTSSVYNNRELKSQYRLFDICEKENTETLVCPIGGSSGLYSKEEFEQHAIRLFFVKSLDFTYPQFNHSFVPNLSILDVMMFNSPEQIREILNKYELI